MGLSFAVVVVAGGRHEAFAEPLVMEAKLLRPTPNPEWLERPALVDELEQAAGARLTLVLAPVGSGKSALLAQWAAVHRGPLAWVTLDSGDDTPVTFWTCVIVGLRMLDPGFGESILVLVRALGTVLVEEVLPRLANALFALGPATLVLDDFQVITDPEIHRGLLFLIERLPPGFRIVMATQSDPGFGLGHLRTRGQLTEIRDLAFSLDESGKLLRQALGTELSADDLQAIHERTEGWVAGLQLAVLSARGRPDPVAFLLDGLPDNRYVLGLLWEEVLAHQSPDVLRFLVETSILERFSAPLCTAVTGREDAEAVIFELERNNAFLVSLDAGGRWHRFHQLFRQALAHQRRKLAAGELAALHRRAGAWYAAHGHVAEAIEHQLAAGDVDAAAAELARAWVPLFSEGHATTILAWLDRFPSEIVAAEPSLCLLAAGISYACGRYRAAERWLGEFETRGPPPDELIGFSQSPTAAAAIIRAMLALARGDLRVALRDARRAYEMETAAGQTLVGHHLGVILVYADDHAAAEPLLTACLGDELIAEGHHAHAVTALGYQSLIALGRGDVSAARGSAREALARARGHHLDEYALTSVAHSALGCALAVDGDPTGVEDHLERAVALARRGSRAYELALARLLLGAGRLRRGDPEGARDALMVAGRQRVTASLPWLARLAQELTRDLAAIAAPPLDSASATALTAAELGVLRLLPSELTYSQIAERLGVSLNTVKTHTSHVRRKLGVTSRAEAVDSARRTGLL